MKNKKECGAFMLAGCVTHTLTFAGIVILIVFIVKGFMNSIGTWPLVAMFAAIPALFIVGGALGFLFYSFAYLMKAPASCKCHCHDDTINQ